MKSMLIQFHSVYLLLESWTVLACSVIEYFEPTEYMYIIPAFALNLRTDPNLFFILQLQWLETISIWLRFPNILCKKIMGRPRSCQSNRLFYTKFSIKSIGKNGLNLDERRFRLNSFNEAWPLYWIELNSVDLNRNELEKCENFVWKIN